MIAKFNFIECLVNVGMNNFKITVNEHYVLFLTTYFLLGPRFFSKSNDVFRFHLMIIWEYSNKIIKLLFK